MSFENVLSGIRLSYAFVSRFKKLQSESNAKEKQLKDLVQALEKSETEMNEKMKQVDDKRLQEQKYLQHRLIEIEKLAKDNEEKYGRLSRELQMKQKIVANLQDELNDANERYLKSQQENDRLHKKIQELEYKPVQQNQRKRLDSLTELINVDLDVDLENMQPRELIEQCLDLMRRFEKAVVEIRAVKRELRDSHMKYDQLELENVRLRKNLEIAEQETRAESVLMAERLQDLTVKLATVEKQARSLKSKLQDSREKRRSLSLKGKHILTPVFGCFSS